MISGNSVETNEKWTFTLTNTFETVDINGTKTWVNDSGYDRPGKDDLVLILKADGVVVDGAVLHWYNSPDPDNWSYGYEDLPKYRAGSTDEIVYTVEEAVPSNYKVEYDGYDITNTLILGGIKITKYGSDGKTVVSDVTYTCEGSDSSYELTTNNSGEVIFEGLIPDTYTITETKTADGLQLLAESVTVTIPLVMTADEVKDGSIDTTNAEQVGSEYYFYDLTYEITNHANLTMPVSGGVPNGVLPIVALALVAGGCGTLVYKKKKKY